MTVPQERHKEFFQPPGPGFNAAVLNTRRYDARSACRDSKVFGRGERKERE
jgi:hypothetical protein